MAGVNTALAEVLLIILVVFSLIFELALHNLEHWVHLRHSYLTPALKIIYRELMILGFVSFIFIMYQTIFQPSPSVVHSFEFAHVFIFLLAITYTCVTLFSLYTSLRLSAKWKRMETVQLDHYVRSKQRYTALRLRMHSRANVFWRAVAWWFPNVQKLVTYRHLHELMAYHDMRFQFIYYRNLPETFRFHKFLRAIKTHTFLNLAHTHWTLYLVLLLICAADVLRRKLNGTHIVDAAHRVVLVRAGDAADGGHDGDKNDDDELFLTDTVESAFYIAGALVLMFAAQILALKIRKIYWQLTKNPRMYYEDDGSTTGLDRAAQLDGDDDEQRIDPSRVSLSRTLGVQNPDHASAILSGDVNTVKPRAVSQSSRYSHKDSAVFEEDITDVTLDDSTVHGTADAAVAGAGAPGRRRASGRRGPGVSFAGLSRDDGDGDGDGDKIESCSEREEEASPSSVSNDELSGGGGGDYGGDNSFVKHQSLAIKSATIAKNREYHETAKKLEARKYPWVIRTLIPRVKRVASPVEKMFWFGSHHFFAWCVQFVLFFSTVLLSAVTSAVILHAVEGSSRIGGLSVAALVLAVFTILFVQLRTATMMKKYSFVLLNASLVPESLERSEITRLTSVDGGEGDGSSGGGAGAGGAGGGRSGESCEVEMMEEEDEMEVMIENDGDGDGGGQNGLRRKQTLAGYMRAEAVKGNMPGISREALLDAAV